MGEDGGLLLLLCNCSLAVVFSPRFRFIFLYKGRVGPGVKGHRFWYVYGRVTRCFHGYLQVCFDMADHVQRYGCGFSVLRFHQGERALAGDYRGHFCIGVRRDGVRPPQLCFARVRGLVRRAGRSLSVALGGWGLKRDLSSASHESRRVFGEDRCRNGEDSCLVCRVHGGLCFALVSFLIFLCYRRRWFLALLFVRTVVWADRRACSRAGVRGSGANEDPPE